VVFVSHSPAASLSVNSVRTNAQHSRRRESSPSGGSLPLRARACHDVAALQRQISAASPHCSCGELNRLLRAVAELGDARAAVHVYDVLGSAG
jgi:hypothetical protein